MNTSPSSPPPAEADALFAAAVSPIDEVLEEFRNGRFVILADDAARENEADLIIAAQMCGPERVNFMATHGRGLICLALEETQVARLGLPMMARHNESRHETAFTVSIEAREGVGTGISAHDRARTIAEAIRPDAGPADIVSPGHIFPLAARSGGVLVRAGHTEAGVDLARLAGLTPAAGLCEIMADDGTMARGLELLAYAKRHDLKLATIADLIAWRSRNDRIVERVSESQLESAYGQFRLVVYRNRITGMEHAALVAGTPSSERETLVRVHALSLLDDILGDVSVGRSGALGASLRTIQAAGEGVVVIIRESPQDLTRRLGDRGDPAHELRDYGEGAQILTDLGIRRMVLLHTTDHSFVGLAGYGLEVSGRRPPGDPT